MIYFETERIYGRELSISDLDAYYAIKSDERVTRMYGMSPYSMERTLKKINSLLEMEGKDAYSISICLKENDQMIGSICL